MSSNDEAHPVIDPVHGGEAERWGGWSWREPSRGEHFRRCSYCGCVHPADLAAEPEWRANWADRKYGWPHKFYVEIPNRDPDRLYVISLAWNAAEPPRGMLAVADLTPEQEEILARDGYGPSSPSRPEYVGLGTRASHFGKFYTVHLADPTLSDDVRAAVEARCGLRFKFADGRVRWEPTIRLVPAAPSGSEEAGTR